MPKGCLLHVHLAAAVNIDKLLKKIEHTDGQLYNAIYYVSDATAVNENKKNSLNVIPQKDMYYNFPNNNDALLYTLMVFTDGLCANNTNGWSRLADATVDEYKEIIYTMSHVNCATTDDAWVDLRASGERNWALIKHTSVYAIYFDLLLSEMYDDGLMHVEIKTSLDQLYSSSKHKSGEYYVTLLDYDIAFKIRDRIKDKYNGKISFGIILSIRRFNREEDASKALQQLKMYAIQYHDQVVGIDVFGKEVVQANKKMYAALKRFDDDITNIPLNLRFSIHAGETTTTDFPVDVNIATSLFLNNCKRIGHCVSLWKYPNLIQIIKERNINVELCPLSNKLLGYVDKIENHPGISYIAQGVSCSINSDDPSAFGYDYVTFDWVECILRWKLSLTEIHQLCIDSINGSFVNDSIKTDMIDAYNKRWLQWLQNLSQYLQPLSGGNNKRTLICVSCNVTSGSKSAFIKHLNTVGHAQKCSKSKNENAHHLRQQKATAKTTPSQHRVDI